MTLIVEIYRRFPTQADCLTNLEKVRWGDTPSCAYCGAKSVCKKTEEGRRDRLQCWGCKKSFSVTTGTAMHNSHVDVRLWYAMIKRVRVNQGITATQISKEFGIRRQTCAEMLRRIRQDDSQLIRLISAD